MKQITEMNSISEMAGISFDCDCGRKHSVDIGKIYIENQGVPEEVLKSVSQFKEQEILLVADTNTYKVYGSYVERMLSDSGFKLRTFVFKTERHLVPDEKALGLLLTEIETETSLVLAVGSGVINDVCKHVCHKTGKPYIILATAPSMDGYASVVSPIIVNGVKKTLSGNYPLAIIADVTVLKDAPMDMLRAGFGDILGKLTALADWKLSRIINNELYCQTCVKLIENALENCISNTDRLLTRDEQAVGFVMEALVLSGIAIGLHGDSRPASGAEHNFAHYWDMDAISKNIEHPLHGNSVAVGTVVTSYVYEYMKPFLPEGLPKLDTQMITGLLKRLGACYSPFALGIDKELFVRSMYEAYKLKPRYTIFNLAEEKGMLDKITKELTEKFYNEA
ncbi:MAG: sn-glycerol-1-phosphate dehydrogenase [Clostridiaceae bacterium]|nr:sn-glycerol-1-phosphate dehydrogenase [Clostridiaceae bacterium]